jgi:hypothetical protein
MHGDLLLGNCHSLIVVCCVISPSDYRRATMPQSHSVIPHIQLVQMVDRPIPTYNRLDPANVGGMGVLFCPLSPDLSKGEVREPH